MDPYWPAVLELARGEITRSRHRLYFADANRCCAVREEAVECANREKESIRSARIEEIVDFHKPIHHDHAFVRRKLLVLLQERWRDGLAAALCGTEIRQDAA